MAGFRLQIAILLIVVSTGARSSANEPVAASAEKPNQADPTPIDKSPILLSRLEGTKQLSDSNIRGARLSPNGEWFVCNDAVWNTATGKRVADHSALKPRPLMIYFTRGSQPILLQFRVQDGTTALVGIDGITARPRFVHRFVRLLGMPKVSPNNALVCLPIATNSTECTPLIIDSASGTKP